MITKELYHLAIPAYFVKTEIHAIVSRMSPPMRTYYTRHLNQNVAAVEKCIIAGTFELHPLFYENVVKLQMEITSVSAIEETWAILAKCKRVTQVTVYYHGLGRAGAVLASLRVKEAVQAAANIGEERQLTLRTGEVQDSEILFSWNGRWSLGLLASWGRRRSDRGRICGACDDFHGWVAGIGLSRLRGAFSISLTMMD